MVAEAYLCCFSMSRFRWGLKQLTWCRPCLRTRPFGLIFSTDSLPDRYEYFICHTHHTPHTEVIIQAYKLWGEGFLNRLNGMFAFALYDEEKQTVLLARDRMGKKPLFYVSGNGGLEFASGIPATIGGAVYMNAGANGKQTADTLKEVGYVTEKGELIRFQKEELHFGYRCSSFHQWRGAIVDAVFHLSPSDVAKVHQKEILACRLKTQPL